MGSYLLKCLTISTLSLAATAWCAETAPLAEGAKIEVREGDTWSTVTFIRKEGRKTLVRYDDGTEEWVTADRLRGGAAGAPAPAPGPAPMPTSPARSSPAAGPSPAPAATPAPSSAAPISLDTYTELDLAAVPEPATRLGTLKPIAPVALTPEHSSVPLRRRFDSGGNSVDRLVVCVDQPNVVVVSCGTVFAEKPEIMCIDLADHRQTIDAVLTTRGQGVVSAADGGKVLLTTVGMGWDPQIHLWELSGDSYRIKANFNPFDNRSPYGKGLALATLLGPDRAIFAARSGEVYLVNLNTRKGVGFVHALANTTPYIHPSGQILAILTGQGTVQLIRLPEFTVAAELPNAANQGSISIDPTGTLAAYLDEDGAVRITKIADGSQVGSVRVANAQVPFSLLDTETLLVGNNTTYDVKTGLPVWIYNRSAPSGDPMRPLACGQLGMLLNSPSGPAVCAATIPHAQAKAAAKTISKDNFVVVPGTNVQISGDLSGFGGEQSQAMKVIKEKLQAARLNGVDDPKASVRLLVELSSLPAEERAFKDDGPAKVRLVKCPCTQLTLTMVAGGQEIWEQTFRYTAGNPVQLKEGQTLQEAVNEAALPTAGMLNFLNFPSFIPKGAVIGSPAALGAGEVTPRSVVPAPKPQPRPKSEPKAPFRAPGDNKPARTNEVSA